MKTWWFRAIWWASFLSVSAVWRSAWRWKNSVGSTAVVLTHGISLALWPAPSAVCELKREAELTTTPG